jgi:hypothetical protein
VGQTLVCPNTIHATDSDAIGYKAFLRNSSTRYSLARQATAAIVSVQFFSGQETNDAPSTTKWSVRRHFFSFSVNKAPQFVALAFSQMESLPEVEHNKQF